MPSGLSFQELHFHQLFDSESSTYTYLLADPQTKEALIIDPVLEKHDRDLQLISECDYKLVYILDTHVHADHITGAAKLKDRTGAKTGISAGAGVVCVDTAIQDGDELKVGGIRVQCRMTPGHTDSCMSYLIPGAAFTGDTLLIRGCGRTDFQQGSSEKLWNSVQNILFSLPESTLIYPAHDYKGFTSSSVAAEKKSNPRLNSKRSKAEFFEIMANLKLDHPKKIHEAVPANLVCGRIS